MKTMVVYVRSNEINDIFNIITIDERTHELNTRFVEYPRSMDMTEDDVYDELED